jgi:hypothetical protein
MFSLSGKKQVYFGSTVYKTPIYYQVAKKETAKKQGFLGNRLSYLERTYL